MIPLYILGLLQRFGPQHGYQIKKIMSEQLSDFTQIKLPTIYYHLEKMEEDGLLLASSEKPGSRPEKKVYSVTAKGIEAFQLKLNSLLDFDYRPSFPSDGVFYFAEHLETEKISEHVKNYIDKLKHKVSKIQAHKNEVLNMIPKEMQAIAEIIFNHHQLHYQAELDWALESLKSLSNQGEILCQNKES